MRTFFRIRLGVQKVAKDGTPPRPGWLCRYVKGREKAGEEPEVADEDDDVNRRLNEALAIRGKTQHGTLIRRVKRLMDALDEEDAEEDPVFEKDDNDKDDDLFGPSDD